MHVTALCRLLGQTQPRRLTLRGAQVHLRFDADGNLLTRFPQKTKGGKQALPEIRIERGTVTVDQAGRKVSSTESVTLRSLIAAAA